VRRLLLRELGALVLSPHRRGRSTGLFFAPLLPGLCSGKRENGSSAWPSRYFARSPAGEAPAGKITLV